MPVGSTGTAGTREGEQPFTEAPPASPPASPSRSRAWLLRIAGTLLFIALLVWLDQRGALPIEGILRTLAGASVLPAALSIALYVPFMVVKAARWRLICRDMGMPVTWASAWRAYAIGLAAGTFTPGQAGDMLKVWYLQRAGHPLARGLASSVLDRLFDVGGLALFALVGVGVYGQRFASQTPALIVLALLCLAGVIFLSLHTTRRWALSFVRRRLARFVPGALGASGSGGVAGASGGAGAAWSLRPATLALAALLTGASFATAAFRVWLLAAALNLFFTPLQVAGYLGLTTAAALVPVTVGGVGTRDAVSTFALAQLGRPPAEAIALSTLILALNAAQAVIGWVVWLRYRPHHASEG